MYDVGIVLHMQLRSDICFVCCRCLSFSQVFDYDLQRQLAPEMEKITPLPSIYYPDFIAANQEDRADNVLDGRTARIEHLDTLRKDIREFREKNSLDKVCDVAHFCFCWCFRILFHGIVIFCACIPYRTKLIREFFSTMRIYSRDPV